MNPEEQRVVWLHQPVIESCPVCRSPRDFGAELQAICIALLDMNTGATEEQKNDHREAVELARGIIRARLRECSRR